MLADFEDLYFSPQQFLVLHRELLLFHDLHSHLFLGLFVDSPLHHPVLTLPQVLQQVVEVEEVSIANGALYRVHPPLLISLVGEVVDAFLVREDKHKGVEDRILVYNFFLLVLDMHPHQALHVLVLTLALLLVRYKH